MATLVGHDVFGNVVQFTADAQTIESASVTKADNSVAAAAGALTGTALKSTVVSSSLTSLGTIAALVATLGTFNGLASLKGGVALGTVPALTAGTTQTLAGATALSTVSVVNAANANDGVKFGVAATGSGRIFIVVSVGSTATMQVWPNLADAIDGGTAGAAVTLTAAHRVAVFIDTAANNWTSALLGAVSS